MNGPPPSTRAFLSQLPSLPADSKVRFLGCVTKYNVATGHLILEHNYPRSRADLQQQHTVSVDINALLETVTWEELRVGAWINVLGYVRRVQSLYVEAIMVFPAGAIALGEYERVLQDTQEVDRRVRRPE
ncbi:hypothetical protein ASPWEDRAFT_50104 [Aspergillus wentii DTO 134E9]|uniref:CST complex subunit Ten1 n=1 Tax=Aspergillus wentii DTO 134E9 TaxID=1073089 RepID=A0A1L9RP08_ASPWE|nr:uncharacterized protein ASPWEDRAFT_50104 [Aspergillus wentii DTO 134E9]OJJ36654.1 hypothetical protein ASPWEDRAFT_50104 [Aspergillus wentii DTO 134E9]